MRAIYFLGDRRVSVEEAPTPRPVAGEVLVRVAAAAICGSDMHGFRQPAMPTSRRTIPGHEACGLVEEVGQGVRHVKRGDPVMVYHIIGCGACKYCLQGLIHYCAQRKIIGSDVDGSDAEYLVAPERNCIPLPEGMSFSEGALCACVGGTTFNVARRLRISGFHSVAVFGLGPIGLAMVVMAKAMGAVVIGTDLVDDRLSMAMDLGADCVIHAAHSDPVQEIMDRTRGGADISIDCSGSGLAEAQAIESTRPLGQVAWVGVNTGEFSWKIDVVQERQLSIVGTWVFNLFESSDVLHFVRARKLGLERLITHTYPLAEASQAFQVFDEGRCGKVVFSRQEGRNGPNKT